MFTNKAKPFLVTLFLGAVQPKNLGCGKLMANQNFLYTLHRASMCRVEVLSSLCNIQGISSLLPTQTVGFQQSSLLHKKKKTTKTHTSHWKMNVAPQPADFSYFSCERNSWISCEKSMRFAICWQHRCWGVGGTTSLGVSFHEDSQENTQILPPTLRRAIPQWVFPP